MNRTILIIVFLVVIICAGLIGFNFFRDAQMAKYFGTRTRPPVLVETFEVRPSVWEPGIEAIGTAKAASGADLSVEAAGVVREILFEANENAEAGQLLVQIDDSAEKADIQAAEANISLLESQLERASTLRQRGVTSQASYDDALAQLEVARSTRARLEAITELKKIEAPFSGVLGIPRVNIGEYVSVGTVVVTLQDLERIEVDFTVPEQKASLLRVGQKVQFGVETEKLIYSGRLTGIDPKVDPQTRLVSAQAILDSPDKEVLPGQFLRVRVVLNQEPNVLSVPQTAVVPSLYGDYVYRVAAQSQDDGAEQLIVNQVFVQTGRRGLDKIEIVSGLEPGDRIVSVGQNRLQNGARVTPAQDRPPDNAGEGM